MSSTQQLILGEGAGGVVQYQISRSLRFNSADSAYLDRTPASAGNLRTWTWSAWVKRSKLGDSVVRLFNANDSGSPFLQTSLRFDTDQLRFYNDANSTADVKSSAVYRDASAWYHIVCAIDTTQATAANRVKLYVNGSQVTALATATYPNQNTDMYINAARAHQIGSSITPSQFFDGYMTEVNFIDGQALTPSSFGQSDPNTGVWSPIKYTGTYGTNGFYLNFSDNSNTTSTTLGKDYSGNGNNWTPNLFSVTAGAGNDSLVDTPTSYGTDTGVGGEVRGNYATWNPLRNGMTLSNGNLAASSANNPGTTGTFGMTSGKWYWEVSPNNGAIFIGLIDTSGSISTQIASSANAWSYYGANGSKYNNGSGASYGATYGSGNVIGVAFDADAGTLVFYKDGVSQGTAYTGLTSGPYFAAISSDQSGTTTTSDSNFGQRPFANTAPSGFKALCTQNLPTPTIGATSTTQANDYFDVSLYTGNGTSQLITNSGGFQPDLFWAKRRDAAASHVLFDAIRGANTSLTSNNTNAENSNWTGQSFGSNGFTVDAGYSGETNFNGGTFVAWQWKANGAGSSNTAGTITSTVSASTTAGFSIVTYTGTGTAATVGHGLGVAPSLIIVKVRANGGANTAWHVYSSVLGNGSYLVLNTTAASDTGSIWNNTSPTSTVFSIGSSAWPQVNNNTGTYVAYCFAPIADYSAFGSYSGNNSSTDGPFVYLGFRPRFIMIKSTSAGTDWVMMDSARNTYNLADTSLYADSANSESTIGTVNDIDFLSNGFKPRNNTGFVNASETYVYAAFAENPFKFSLAR